MKNLLTTICLLAVLIGNPAKSAIRYVPDDYPTIQAAVNACTDFDTIVIEPGIYTGAGNREIKLNGIPLTIRSVDPCDPNIVNNTIIDCQGQARGFACYLGENIDVTIAGLTITNGYGLLGGAIYSYNNSSPKITNCVFVANTATFGGAIATANNKSEPIISNCTINANAAIVGGGGIYCNGSSPTIKNCIIAGNYATDGGAIFSHNAGSPLITNCTITANASDNSAAGIYCYKSSNATIKNSILWGNASVIASEVRVKNMGAPTSIKISNCDIQDRENSVACDSDCTIEWGLGNIDSDPCFIEMGSIAGDTYVAGDYHLLEDSACIDAGDPEYIAAAGETDLEGHRRILGGIIDIGAYEFVTPITADIKITPQCLNLVSKGEWIMCTIQLPEEYNVADIDTDTIVLNGTIQPQWSQVCKKDEQKLLVKFSRDEVEDMLKDVCGDASLEVWGMLNDGTVFKGTDTIKVISRECKNKYFKFCCHKYFFYKNLRFHRSHNIRCNYMLPHRAFLNKRKFHPCCF
jgi:hypothetical protein